MKKLLVMFGLGIASLVSVPNRADAGASFGIFYSSLSPHGEWIFVDNDVYAWRPGRVASGWRPYLYGSWAWSDYGWYWLSEEPWAWATYHYGRWYYDEYYGWVWIPGYEWAPAWVEWRYGGDYLGWAPLGPYAIFSMRFGVYYTRHWATPVSWWSFVPCGAMHHRDIHRYVYRTNEAARLIGRTRGAGSVRYEDGRIVSRGPERSYVERRGGGERLERLKVVDSDDPGRQRVVRSEGSSRVEAYRPRVDADLPSAGADRPERVRSGERTLPLDTRNIDSRSKDRQREDGRDLRRAEGRKTDMNRPTLERSNVERSRPERSAPSMRTPTESRVPAPADRERERLSREAQPRIERAPWPRERMEKQSPVPQGRSGYEQQGRSTPRRSVQPERSSPPRYERPERSAPSGGTIRQQPGRRETPSRSGETRSSSGSGRRSRER
jgi:hypothetical protein